MIERELTDQIIGCAIEVHRHLGPGLLESAYEECLCHEFSLNKIPFERQKTLPIIYKNLAIATAYRLDLLVNDSVVIEVKSVEKLLPVHEAQLLTYLKLTGKRTGLLLNFHSAVLKDGLRRLVL